MGLGDAFNKAKDAAADHPEQVEQGIDAVGEQATNRLGEEHADKINQGTDAAKEHLLGEQGQEGEEQA